MKLNVNWGRIGYCHISGFSYTLCGFATYHLIPAIVWNKHSRQPVS